MPHLNPVAVIDAAFAQRSLLEGQRLTPKKQRHLVPREARVSFRNGNQIGQTVGSVQLYECQ